MRLFVTLLLPPSFLFLPLFLVSGADLSAGDTEVEAQVPPAYVVPFPRVLLSLPPACSVFPVLTLSCLLLPLLWLSPLSAFRSRLFPAPFTALCVLCLVFVHSYTRLLAHGDVCAEGGLWSTRDMVSAPGEHSVR